MTKKELLEKIDALRDALQTIAETVEDALDATGDLGEEVND